MAPSPLKSGTYEPKNEVQVLVWPSPDPDGDGVAVTDDQGDTWTSPDGREIKHYLPPKGFVNKPHTNEHGQNTADNYVLADDRGNVARDAGGNAVSIAEGQAVVISPGGVFSVLSDNAAMRAFAQSHNAVSSDTPDVQPAPSVSSGAQPPSTGTAQPTPVEQQQPTPVEQQQQPTPTDTTLNPFGGLNPFPAQQEGS